MQIRKLNCNIMIEKCDIFHYNNVTFYLKTYNMKQNITFKNI